MYPYNFEYSSGFGDGGAFLGGVAGFFLAFFILIYLALFAFSVLSYVLTSLGLYKIAKRRGLRNPWLSWLPSIGQIWILGSISDQYHYMVKGNTHNRRKIMLWLMIISYVVLIPTYVVLTLSGIGITGDSFGNGTLAGAGLAFGLIAYGMIIIASIALSIFYYITLYDLYASCSPSDAALYLVLSIFLSVTLPFLIFACRKKDLGMQFLHPSYRQRTQPPVIEAQAVPTAPAPEEPVTEALPEPSVPVAEEATEEIIDSAIVEENTEEPAAQAADETDTASEEPDCV